MSGNLHRLTASRILLVFAVALFIVSLLALQIRLKRAQLEWIEYPTALGDQDFYDPAKGIGTNDFHEPNLKFPGRPEGIFRRSRDSSQRPDAEMLAVGRDLTGAFTVYTPRQSEGLQSHSLQSEKRRYFLKVAEDHYIEFGERKDRAEFDAAAAPQGKQAQSGAGD